jgi:hypothetical protein
MKSLAAFFVSCVLFASRSLGLDAGFAEADITPKMGGGAKSVWMAGYGQGRKAEGVHDPLVARGVVLRDGTEKIALICTDLVGFQFPDVEKVRAKLKDYHYVLVSSTHNHEGPDVIGIWGKNPFTRGVDDSYIAHVVEQIVALVREAEKSIIPDVTVRFGTATDESLLGDSREPKVIDGVLRTLAFHRGEKMVGLVTQWNAHPESLGSKNKQLTADFPYATVAALKEKYGCPMVYLTGAVGGLLTPASPTPNPAGGEPLHDGNFEFAEAYGKNVAALAEKAIAAGEDVALTPLRVETRRISIPVVNTLYRVASGMGVLPRDAFVWTEDRNQRGEPLGKDNAKAIMAIETEVGCLRLGDVAVAAIPGEIYSELVYGKFQDPADPGADYPDAPLEPSIAALVPCKHWLLIGLANDETGYLIPRRQWDAKAPYAYGRSSSQYGEMNSCGPDSAAHIMAAFKECADALR